MSMNQNMSQQKIDDRVVFLEEASSLDHQANAATPFVVSMNDPANVKVPSSECKEEGNVQVDAENLASSNDLNRERNASSITYPTRQYMTFSDAQAILSTADSAAFATKEDELEASDALMSFAFKDSTSFRGTSLMDVDEPMQSMFHVPMEDVLFEDEGKHGVEDTERPVLPRLLANELIPVDECTETMLSSNDAFSTEVHKKLSESPTMLPTNVPQVYSVGALIQVFEQKHSANVSSPTTREDSSSLVQKDPSSLVQEEPSLLVPENASSLVAGDASSLAQKDASSLVQDRFVPKIPEVKQPGTIQTPHLSNVAMPSSVLLPQSVARKSGVPTPPPLVPSTTQRGTTNVEPNGRKTRQYLSVSDAEMIVLHYAALTSPVNQNETYNMTRTNAAKLMPSVDMMGNMKPEPRFSRDHAVHSPGGGMATTERKWPGMLHHVNNQSVDDIDDVENGSVWEDYRDLEEADTKAMEHHFINTNTNIIANTNKNTSNTSNTNNNNKNINNINGNDDNDDIPALLEEQTSDGRQILRKFRSFENSGVQLTPTNLPIFQRRCRNALFFQFILYAGTTALFFSNAVFEKSLPLNVCMAILTVLAGVGIVAFFKLSPERLRWFSLRSLVLMMIVLYVALFVWFIPTNYTDKVFDAKTKAWKKSIYPVGGILYVIALSMVAYHVTKRIGLYHRIATASEENMIYHSERRTTEDAKNMSVEKHELTLV